MGQVTDYLRDSVYPKLDAVQGELLSDLSPQPSKNGRLYYTLTCPVCHRKGRAFYYPGNAFIVCNRRNECENTNLYNYVKDHRHLNNAQTIELLCQAAGVDVPFEHSKGHSPTHLAQHKKREALQATLLTLFRRYLQEHAGAQTYLKDRGYTRDDLAQMKIGYYPSWETLERDLKSAGVDIAQVMAYHILPDEERRQAMAQGQKQPSHWLFNGRIVGFWTGPEGLALWGRKLSDDAPGPKYFFSPGTDKTIPYGWVPGAVSFPWCVEGNLDAEALNLMGVYGLGVGGNALNHAQAAYLASRQVTQFGFITDGDKAGIEGGISTVERCEPLGITTYIAVVPNGFDDVDAMRRNGQTREFHHLIQHPIVGGTFIARMALTKIQEQPANATQIFNKALRIYHSLTPASQLGFAHTMLQYGYPLPDFTQAMADLTERLKAAGLHEEAAQHQAQRVYGLMPSTQHKPHAA